MNTDLEAKPVGDSADDGSQNIVVRVRPSRKPRDFNFYSVAASSMANPLDVTAQRGFRDKRQGQSYFDQHDYGSSIVSKMGSFFRFRLPTAIKVTAITLLVASLIVVSIALTYYFAISQK